MAVIGVGPFGRKVGWWLAPVRFCSRWPVAWRSLTLNAPARRNALTLGMAEELIATFDEVDAKPGVGALVVRGVCKSARAATSRR